MHALVQAIFRAPITLMVAKVYVPVLFPLTFMIALLALPTHCWDSHLFESPTNWIVPEHLVVGFAPGFGPMSNHSAGKGLRRRQQGAR